MNHLSVILGERGFLCGKHLQWPLLINVPLLPTNVICATIIRSMSCDSSSKEL